MTPVEYWRNWTIAGALFLAALYVVIVAAIVTAERVK